MAAIKKMRFWGTSGGDGMPTPFCKCPVCEYAREHGGPDLRTRASFRIDEKVMIDAGADFVSQATMYREHTFDLEHVLFTHMHNDHYNRELLWLRNVAKVIIPEHTINIWCSEEAMKEVVVTYERQHGEALFGKENVKLNPMKFYETYQVGDYKITPLKGKHKTVFEENSANYLIKFPNGKTMYYAVDTGPFIDETIEYLKGKTIDLLIMECTFVMENFGAGGHMDLTCANEEFDRLLGMNVINETTPIYLTHIATRYMNHHEIVDYWKKKKPNLNITVAYDGLCIEDIM